VDYGRIVDTLYAHDDAVSSMCAHNDLLITGSWDSTVKVWKARPTGIDKSLCADFVDHESEVKCVALSKDGNIVASGAIDGKICYSDIRAGSSIRKLHAHGSEVTCIKFTEDGRLISTGIDNCIRVFDVTGQELLQIDFDEVFRCMATNGEYLLLGGDTGLLRPWNISSTENIHKLKKENMSPLTCLTTNSTGHVVVSGDEEGTITHWTLPAERDD